MTNSASRRALSTIAIHHGYDPARHHDALNPPIFLSSTFVFPTAEAGGARFAGEQEGNIYSRLGNPTIALLESRLAALEVAEAAVGTASGMGAISATLWSLLRSGDEIVTDLTLYGCTFALFRHAFTRFGITVTRLQFPPRSP